VVIADQDPSDLSETLTGLTSEFSVEVTPRELRHGAAALDVLPPRTRVYITFLANTPFAETVSAAGAVIERGLCPVPHLAARAVANHAELDTMIGQLSDVGVSEILVIGGSLSAPAGEFTESMQILRAPSLHIRGIQRIGVAGHPEGNKDITEHELARALAEKNEIAAERGLEMYLLTQFCFAAEPIIAWEHRIRAAGNTLPVYIGLPGLSTPVKLLKYGLSCGIGPSLKVLRKQAGGVLKLATKPVYYPDQTLLGLARAVRDDAESLIHGVHFFPFGALTATAAWASGINAGKFHIGDDMDGLEIVG
jgi:methylenetetrahydrofolate reductase (NADPH)